MAVRMSDVYDIVVIGSGTGGYSCALRRHSWASGRDRRARERLAALLLRGCIPPRRSAVPPRSWNVNRPRNGASRLRRARLDAVGVRDQDRRTSSSPADEPGEARKIDGSGVPRPAGGAGRPGGRSTITATDVLPAHRVAPKLLPVEVTPGHHERRGAVVRRDPSSAGSSGRGDRARFASFYRRWAPT